MKKGMLVVLMAMVLFLTASVSVDAQVSTNPQVQTKSDAGDLLNFVGAVDLSEKFIVGDYFKVDMSDSAVVKIAYLDDDFQNWFSYKTEKSTEELSMRFHILLKPAKANNIIVELGGKAKSETNFVSIYKLMKLQPHGEAGFLLTNDNGNIFFVRDVNSVLRFIQVRWLAGGWIVRVFSFEDPPDFKWSIGTRVFSH